MKRRRYTRLGVEALERRDLMAGFDPPEIDLRFAAPLAQAGNVTAEVIDGTLVVRGDSGNNEIIIEQLSEGRFAIQGGAWTTINGRDTGWGAPYWLEGIPNPLESGPIQIEGVTRGVSIEMGDGNDSVMLAGRSLPATEIETGAGNDSVSFYHGHLIVSPYVILASYWPPGPAMIHGNLRVDTGSGDDFVSPFAEVQGDAAIRTGSGADRIVPYTDISQGTTILRKLEATGTVIIDLGFDEEDPGVPANWRDDPLLVERIDQHVAAFFEDYRDPNKVPTGHNGLSPGNWGNSSRMGRLLLEIRYDWGQSEVMDRLERRGVTLRRLDKYGLAEAWVTESELALFSGLPGLQWVSAPLSFVNNPPNPQPDLNPDDLQITPDHTSVPVISPLPLVDASVPVEQPEISSPIVDPVVADSVVDSPIINPPANDPPATIPSSPEPRVGDSAERAQLAGPRVEISLEITALDGSLLGELRAGQDFLLHVYVDDLRIDGRGVFSAYMDMLWDRGLAKVTGALRFSADYPIIRGGDSSTAGLLDEAGATGNLAPPGPERREMFSVPMQALAPGALRFMTSPSENLSRETTMHGDDGAIPASLVGFGATSIDVVGTGEIANKSLPPPQLLDGSSTASLDSAQVVEAPFLTSWATEGSQPAKQELPASQSSNSDDLLLSIQEQLDSARRKKAKASAGA